MIATWPLEPTPTDEGFRTWLLRRLDLMRAMVEAGEDMMVEDGNTVAHVGRSIRVASFHIYEDVWLKHHDARGIT